MKKAVNKNYVSCSNQEFYKCNCCCVWYEPNAVTEKLQYDWYGNPVKMYYCNDCLENDNEYINNEIDVEVY